jgi:hypothetical protein
MEGSGSPVQATMNLGLLLQGLPRVLREGQGDELGGFRFAVSKIFIFRLSTKRLAQIIEREIRNGIRSEFFAHC